LSAGDFTFEVGAATTTFNFPGKELAPVVDINSMQVVTNPSELNSRLMIQRLSPGPSLLEF
jgi:hypothetical protein